MEAEMGYEEAYRQALSLSPVDPLRLNRALNYSVFLVEDKNDIRYGIKVASEAFEDGISGDLEDLKEQEYEEVAKILQNLHDNLLEWTN